MLSLKTPMMRERNALDGDVLADGGLRAAEELDRQRQVQDHDLGVRGGILVVEEAAGQHHQAAHLLILRRDAQQHGVLGDAAAHADAVVDLQHGRVGDDARDRVWPPLPCPRGSCSRACWCCPGR